MPEPEKTAPVNPGQVTEQPTREITQTDHINKKLLTSLFKRLDEGDSTLSNMLNDDTPTQEDEWKD